MRAQYFSLSFEVLNIKIHTFGLKNSKFLPGSRLCSGGGKHNIWGKTEDVLGDTLRSLCF